VTYFSVIVTDECPSQLCSVQLETPKRARVRGVGVPQRVPATGRDASGFADAIDGVFEIRLGDGLILVEDDGAFLRGAAQSPLKGVGQTITTAAFCREIILREAQGSQRQSKLRHCEGDRAALRFTLSNPGEAGGSNVPTTF